MLNATWSWAALRYLTARQVMLTNTYEHLVVPCFEICMSSGTIAKQFSSLPNIYKRLRGGYSKG